MGRLRRYKTLSSRLAIKCWRGRLALRRRSLKREGTALSVRLLLLLLMWLPLLFPPPQNESAYWKTRDRTMNACVYAADAGQITSSVASLLPETHPRTYQLAE